MTEDGDPMGLKLTGPFRCGACGKPRGLGVHVCSPGRRRRRRTALRNPVAWECSRCKQPRGLNHTCGNRGDFKRRRREAATAERRRKRKAVAARRAARRKQAAADRRRKRKAVAARRAARRKQAAADRRARDKARKQAAKGKPRSGRPRGESHEPGTCGNRECPKYGCKAYWQGMADCLGPHEGE